MSSRILSLIVARANSKGLRNKNILELHGKMVFEYSVDYSRELEELYNIHTMVSTDSKTIIDYCEDNHIDVLPRKEHLASDTARIDDVVYDVCNELDVYDYISILYGDVPTRHIDLFNTCVEYISSYDGVMSMREIEYSPEYTFRYNHEKLERNYHVGYRRQDERKLIRHDGHTILIDYNYFMEYKRSNKEQEYLYQPFGENIKPIINEYLVVPINDERDYNLAKKILR